MDEEVAKYREGVDLSISISRLRLILGEKLPFRSSNSQRSTLSRVKQKKESYDSSKWRYRK
jgi:hypothetical protein